MNPFFDFVFDPERVVDCLLFLFTATKAALEPDVALYIGLSVAVVVIIVFVIVGIVMLRVLRRKHGHSPMFPVGASGNVQFIVQTLANVGPAPRSSE
jgi:phosphatidylglycerophosphate synthase